MLKKLSDALRVFLAHFRRAAYVSCALAAICVFPALAFAQNGKTCALDNIKSVKIKSPKDYKEYEFEVKTVQTAPSANGSLNGRKPAPGEKLKGDEPAAVVTFKPDKTVKIELIFKVEDCDTLDKDKIKFKDVFNDVFITTANPLVKPDPSKPDPGSKKYIYTAEISPAAENRYFRLSIYYGEDKIENNRTGHVDYIIRERKQSTGNNGIYVIAPKVYDERSLAEKLLELETSLASKLYIDPARVAAAVGNMQGARMDVSTLNVQATTLPLPGVTQTSSLSTTSGAQLANTIGSSTTQTTNTNTGSMNTTTNTTSNSSTNSNTSTGSTANTSTNVSMPSVTPTAPSLASQTPAINPTLQYGQAASTLLAEQMQLSYEIINIRTLLERAVSDNVDLTSSALRRQAVLGFRIGIDSRKEYEGAIAEVKVKVKSMTPQKRANIVSLIPQEKTYNTATITKNSKQFGFGAVIQVVNLGVSASNSKDTFYLVRDNDTVAMEGTPFDDNDRDEEAATFSWQFRPVLGQRIVQPGTRNVLALLSLPPGDIDGDDEDATYVAEIEVETQWRKYDAKKRTIGKPVSDPAKQYFQTVVIPSYTGNLVVPEIETINWEDARNGQALVVLKGKKFARGTGILAGTSLINSPANGLFISDEENLRFSIPLAQLGVLSDVYLSGRYGSPKKLEKKLEEGEADRLSITGVHKESLINNEMVKIIVRIKCNKNGCSEEFFENQKPLAIIGNLVFGAIQSPITVTRCVTVENAKDGNKSEEPDDCKKVKYAGSPDKMNKAGGQDNVPADAAKNGRYEEFALSFQAPAQLLSEDIKIYIRYPFLPARGFLLEKEIKAEQSFSATGVIPVSNSGDMFQLAIRGTKFVNCRDFSGAAFTTCKERLKVRVGNNTFKVGETNNGSTLERIDGTLLYLNLKMTHEQLASVSHIIVIQDDKPVILPVDLKAPPLPKPEFKEPFPKIKQGDSNIFQFKGKNFSSLRDIKFEGINLEFSVKDGENVDIKITTEITALSGTKRLDYTLKDGKTGSFTITVN